MANIYFELTREFNAEGPVALLASGQAVVYYRLAIMSKDGDWILREDPEACRKVLGVLARYGARYRPGAPLDAGWLAGGWSSHFEFQDENGRRVRCDFVTRAPRVPSEVVHASFAQLARTGDLPVVGLEALMRMKRTQRAKDYPVIAELARLTPPAVEVEYTTDPDRILSLAPRHGQGSARPAVRAALAGEGRDAVVLALAREVDQMQQRDRRRMERYHRAARGYLREFQRLELGVLPLEEAHPRVLALARALLPREPPREEE